MKTEPNTWKEFDRIVEAVILEKVDTQDPMDRAVLEARVHSHMNAHRKDLMSYRQGELFCEEDCERIYQVIDRMMKDE